VPAERWGTAGRIFVIDIAGLRVVHLGDLGQDALTPAQLAAIGKADVLEALLSNSFSSMTVRPSGPRSTPRNGGSR
jgi:hypothetical protein